MAIWSFVVYVFRQYTQQMHQLLHQCVLKFALQLHTKSKGEGKDQESI